MAPTTAPLARRFGTSLLSPGREEDVRVEWRGGPGEGKGTFLCRAFWEGPAGRSAAWPAELWERRGGCSVEHGQRGDSASPPGAGHARGCTCGSTGWCKYTHCALPGGALTNRLSAPRHLLPAEPGKPLLFQGQTLGFCLHRAVGLKDSRLYRSPHLPAECGGAGPGEGGTS